MNTITPKIHKESPKTKELQKQNAYNMHKINLVLSHSKIYANRKQNKYYNLLPKKIIHKKYGNKNNANPIYINNFQLQEDNIQITTKPLTKYTKNNNKTLPNKRITNHTNHIKEHHTASAYRPRHKIRTIICIYNHTFNPTIN